MHAVYNTFLFHKDEPTFMWEESIIYACSQPFSNTVKKISWENKNRLEVQRQNQIRVKPNQRKSAMLYIEIMC